MLWRCNGCVYLMKNDDDEFFCDCCDELADSISDSDCPLSTVIWGFETSPDYEYSVLMPTETNLIFCGFFDTKKEAETYAKKIHGIVLHDMRYARG